MLFGARIKEGLDLARVSIDDELVDIPEEPIERNNQPVDWRRSPERPTSRSISPVTVRGSPQKPLSRDVSPITIQGTPEPAQAFPIAAAESHPYRSTHIDARDAIALSAMVIKRQYDNRYTAMFFSVGDYVGLRLYRGYTVPGLRDRNTKLEQ